MKFLFYKIPAAFFILFLLTINFSAQTEREKGIEFYEDGNYKTATELLQKAVETNQTDGEAWGFLGMAFAKINDKKQALKAFHEADKFRVNLDENYDTPLKITYKSNARYTDTARQNRVSGRIKLAVEFRHDGKIGFIFPLMELPDGLTENTIEAAGYIKFNPAVRSGKPITVIKFIQYGFRVF